MTHRLTAILGLLALSLTFAGTASATVLNFAKNEFGAVPPNNQDINVTYGSNVANAANVYGATDGGEGFTPNIAVAFQPTGGGDLNFIPDGNILEFHSAVTFTNAGFTVPVLQLDWDETGHENGLPADPTIDFVPEAGWAVKIHELRIGNASDQIAPEFEPYHPWTISILELPSLTEVDSYTTAGLGPTNAEIATFDYTGLPGVSYRLRFNDGGSLDDPFNQRHPRTGIDNVRFSQVGAGTPGDFDGDDDVDGRDFLAWQRGASPNGTPGGPVSAADLAEWQGAYNGGALSAVTVPEPASGILLIASLALVAGRGAARKRCS